MPAYGGVTAITGIYLNWMVLFPLLLNYLANIQTELMDQVVETLASYKEDLVLEILSNGIGKSF